MKKQTVILIVLGSMICQLAMAQSTSVCSVPAGYTKITIPAAPSTTTASYTTFSLTLSNEAVHAGVLSGVDGTNNLLTDSSASWSAGGWSQPSSPHYVKITSGAAAGRVFSIISNTGTDLEVNLGTPAISLTEPSITAQAGARYEIVTADTLGSLFGTTDVPFKVSPNAADADQIKVWSAASQAWFTYWNDGSKWLRVAGGSTNRNNTVLDACSGIQFVRRDPTSLELLLTGRVVSGTVRTPIGQSTIGLPGKSFVASPFVVNPTPVTLNSSGIADLPGWVKNASSTNADRVQVYAEASQSWFTYWHDGSKWLRVAGGSTDRGGIELSAGNPLYVIRLATQSGADAILTQNSSF